MRLSFDATRFGSGLLEAVELAALRDFAAFEYGFSRFDVSEKKLRQLTDTEKDYLLAVSKLCREKNIEISCLKLDMLLSLKDKSSQKEFKGSIEKISKVASALSCRRIVFYLEADPGPEFLNQVESLLAPLISGLKRKGIKLLLSLSTPACFIGKSLRSWRPLEPDEWRTLLAGLPDLGLSFSVADCVWQGIDYLRIISNLVPAIEHVQAQDIQVNRQIISENGLFGPLWWRYLTPGKGQVDWGQFVEALKLYEYKGDLAIQFRDEFASENEQGLLEALETSSRLLAPLVKY